MFFTYYQVPLNTSATIVVWTALVLFVSEKVYCEKLINRSSGKSTGQHNIYSSLGYRREWTRLCPVVFMLNLTFFYFNSLGFLHFFSFQGIDFTRLCNLPRSSNWIFPRIDFVRDKSRSWWVQSQSCWHREAHHLPGSVIPLTHSKESGLREQTRHSLTCSDC